LIALSIDAANNSLWRSSAIITTRSDNSGTSQNESKAPMMTSSYKRPHGNIGQSSHVSHGNFGDNVNNSISGNRGSWGHPKNVKSYFKSSSKSHISGKKLKHNGAHLAPRATTRGARPRTKSLPTSTIYVAGQMLVLIVVRSVTIFLIAPSLKPYYLRVL